MNSEPPVFEVDDSGGCDQPPTLSGCGGAVRITERGNPDYAWYYLTNHGDQDAGVTIQKRWRYNNECRTQTERIELYPREDREVFSFNRKQDPRCSILSCSLASEA